MKKHVVIKVLSLLLAVFTISYVTGYSFAYWNHISTKSVLNGISISVGSGWKKEMKALPTGTIDLSDPDLYDYYMNKGGWFQTGDLFYYGNTIYEVRTGFQPQYNKIESSAWAVYSYDIVWRANTNYKKGMVVSLNGLYYMARRDDNWHVSKPNGQTNYDWQRIAPVSDEMFERLKDSSLPDYTRLKSEYYQAL